MSGGSHNPRWLRPWRQDGRLLADIERAFRRDSDPGTERGLADFNEVANSASQNNLSSTRHRRLHGTPKVMQRVPGSAPRPLWPQPQRIPPRPVGPGLSGRCCPNGRR